MNVADHVLPAHIHAAGRDEPAAALGMTESNRATVPGVGDTAELSGKVKLRLWAISALEDPFGERNHRHDQEFTAVHGLFADRLGRGGQKAQGVGV